MINHLRPTALACVLSSFFLVSASAAVLLDETEFAEIGADNTNNNTDAAFNQWATPTGEFGEDPGNTFSVRTFDSAVRMGFSYDDVQLYYRFGSESYDLSGDTDYLLEFSARIRIEENANFLGALLLATDVFGGEQGETALVSTTARREDGALDGYVDFSLRLEGDRLKALADAGQLDSTNSLILIRFQRDADVTVDGMEVNTDQWEIDTVKLTSIDNTIPEPSSAGLLALTASLLLRRRRS